jgi:hypothetical protein
LLARLARDEPARPWPAASTVDLQELDGRRFWRVSFGPIELGLLDEKIARPNGNCYPCAKIELYTMCSAGQGVRGACVRAASPPNNSRSCR